MRNRFAGTLLCFALAGVACASQNYSATFAADYSVFKTPGEILAHGGGSLSGQGFEVMQQLLADPAKVQYLDVSRCDFGSFEDRYVFFANFRNLKYLNISGCRAKIDLFELLAAMPSLKELQATRNTVIIHEKTEVDHGLEKLMVAGCGISDLSPLARLNKLQEVYLMMNNVTNILPLLEIPSIELIEVTHNKVNKIPLIKNKPNFRELHIASNPICATTNWYQNAKYIADMKIVPQDAATERGDGTDEQTPAQSPAEDPAATSP